MKISTKFILGTCLITLMSFYKPAVLSVTSSAFNDNGMIPAKYSCEGAEVSPPLTVAGSPSGTKSLAVIVHDPDAPHPGGVTHWVAWNLLTDGNLPEDFKGGSQGQNSDHKKGYKGMCPPTGTHHYHFKVYALDTELQLDSTTDKLSLEKAMQGHILAQGELIGLYSKSK